MDKEEGAEEMSRGTGKCVECEKDRAKRGRWDESPGRREVVVEAEEGLER